MSTRANLPTTLCQASQLTHDVFAFTVLIEGAMGPESHPIFIEVLGSPPVSDGDWEVARAGTDGKETDTVELKTVWLELPLATG